MVSLKDISYRGGDRGLFFKMNSKEFASRLEHLSG